MFKSAQTYLAEKSDREVARIIGIRRKVGKGGRGKLLRAANKWEKWEFELLGKYPDQEVARRTGRRVSAINFKRRALRIRMYNSPVKRWKDWDRKLLGKCSDDELAERTGRSVEAIRGMRPFFWN
jgi:hypothetical protein